MAKQEKTAAEIYREERKARIAKAAKKNAKKSHKIILSKGAKKAIAVVIVIAIAAGIGAFAVNNSGVLERGKVAFNVGETEVTAAEYSYYYGNLFNYYFNYSYQYEQYGQGMGVMYTGYDFSKSPDEQAYAGEIEGVEEPTFADFFDYSAKENIKYTKAALAYAEEKGITLDENDLAEVEKSMEEMEASVKESGYSLPAYLRAFYGKGMSVGLLREITEEQKVVTKVETVATEEFAESYSDKKVEKEYSENLTIYGQVSLRNYVIKAEKVDVTKEAETEGEEPTVTQETTKETMADAKAKAESFVAKVTDEDSFKAAASEFEKEIGSETYKDMLTNDTLTLMKNTTYSDLSYDTTDEKFLDWAFAEDTAAGETYIVETEGTGYTVYMMVAPVHKAVDAYTYDVRHILFKFPEEEETAEEATEETEETKEEETEEVEVEKLDTAAYKDVTIDNRVDLEATGDKALYKQAQDVLVKYLEGDKTEDTFAALAMEYSADGNAEQGGIYEDVTEGYMVAEFEDWALTEGREYGDVGIVETQFGYHVMYFIDSTKTTWEDTIRADLANVDYSALRDELLAKDNVKIDGIVEESMTSTEEFFVKLAKQQIRNIQSHSADDGHNH